MEMKSYLTVGHMGKGRIGVGRMEANKIGTSHNKFRLQDHIQRRFYCLMNRVTIGS